MKTAKQYLIFKLTESGMPESMAEKVFEKALPYIDSLVPNYQITWNAPWMEYPNVTYDLLFIALRPIALEYIEANCPQAWFKSMFL